METILWTTNNKESSEKLYSKLNYLKDKHAGKQVDYIISIKKNSPVRSQSQHGYYFVCLQAIASETGDTKDQLHEWYKLEYNSVEFRGKMIAKSTTDLDTAEFTIYLNKVIAHAREFHNVYIASPGDRSYNVWEQVTKDKYNAMYSSL